MQMNLLVTVFPVSDLFIAPVPLQDTVRSVMTMHFTLPTFLMSVLFAGSSSLEPLQVDILTPTIYPPVLIGAYVYTGPAFDTALEDIRRSYPLLKVTQHVIYDPSVRSCPDWEAQVDDRVASAYYRLSRNSSSQRLTALIFAGCTEAFQLTKLATQWDIPIITSIFSTPGVRDKVVAPTWITTTTNSYIPYIHFYRKLLRMHRWTNAYMILDSGSNPYFGSLAKYVKADLETQRDLLLDFISVNSASGHGLNYTATLRVLKRSSRVCLFFGHSTILRNLLIAATDLNMTNGEYVYIAVTPFRHAALGNFSWNYGDPYDKVAQAAFRSLFLLEMDDNKDGGSELNSLEAIWRNKSASVYNSSYKVGEMMAPHPASSYSAMMIFAKVISEIYFREPRTDFSRGSSLAKAFVDRTFHLRSGNVTIDGVGERIPHVILRQPGDNPMIFQTVMSQNTSTFDIVPVSNISWFAGSWPVPSRPVCGFDGTYCRTTETGSTILYAIVACLALLFISGLFFGIQRMIGQRVELDNPWWSLSPSMVLPPPVRRIKSIAYSMLLRQTNLKSAFR